MMRNYEGTDQQTNRMNPRDQQQQRPQVNEYQSHPGELTGYTETITLDEAGPPKRGSNSMPNALAQSDLLDEILTNRDLLVSKSFYFFFFAAFGSLFPLMAVYFKQLGMNSIQAGILIGIRPFIEIISAPFWGSLADRFHKGKLMLLFSLVAWILFTCSMAYIRPPASACVIFNATHHVLYTPYTMEDDDNYEVSVTERGKRSIRSPILWPALNEDQFRQLHSEKQYEREELFNLKTRSTLGYTGSNEVSNNDLSYKHPIMKKEVESSVSKGKGYKSVDPKVRHKAPPNHIIGKSPTSIDYTLNYNKDKHASYVSPPFSTIVYRWDDVEEVFFLLLLLVILGEFFSAPAITLADSVTLSYLGEYTDLYGRQRMFGSAGWAISMFLVGIALDNATEFTNHPCGPHESERNYKVCFSIFAFLMALAFLGATQFRFEYDIMDAAVDPENIQMKRFENGTPGPRSIFNTAPPINPPPGIGQQPKYEFLDRWKSAVFAQRTRELPEWMTVLRNFGDLRNGGFLFVTWFMGLGMGLVFTFLFWHLQDLGGTPTLFGMASVINHISEITAYFYSLKFIKELGHTRVICIGLAGNVGRFLYISWLDNPWFILPFEFIQGITHATVWAAACSYVTQISVPELRSSTQGVLQGLHHGLGRGCGAVLGGVLINTWGTRVTFCLYGLLSIFVLGFYIYVNYKRVDGGFRWFEDETDHQVIFEEGGALAPHGVPSNPINKSHSRHNLNQPQQKQPLGSTGAGGQSQQQYYQPTDSSKESYLDPNYPQWGSGTNEPGGGSHNYTAKEFGTNLFHPLLLNAICQENNVFNFDKNYCDSPTTPVYQFDKIKEAFKNYIETTNNETMTWKDQTSCNKQAGTTQSSHDLLPQTLLFSQQPVIVSNSDYEW